MSDPVVTPAEALEDLTKYLSHGGIGGVPDDNDQLVLTAARERLEMGEGERVWWCLEHEDSQSACLLSDPDEFDPWISAAHHFVKARLFLDKGEA